MPALENQKTVSSVMLNAEKIDGVVGVDAPDHQNEDQYRAVQNLIGTEDIGGETAGQAETWMPAGVEKGKKQADEIGTGERNPADKEMKQDEKTAEQHTDDSNLSTVTAEFTLDEITTILADQTYSADGQDQSTIYVTHGGDLTLESCRLLSIGDSSSTEYSSFYGLNSSVLATTGSTITLTDCSISTSGDGANGVFANGEGTQIFIENTDIECSGEYAHAVMATLGGSLSLSNVDMTTSGSGSGAIATDRGSGTIQVAGGRVLTTGESSPGIYSSGDINVEGVTIEATGSQMVVIEGDNTVTAVNSNFASSYEDGNGVMLYQSTPGDTQGQKGVFTMSGGTLEYTAENAPLFFVTNTTGIITLKGVEVNAVSGNLLQASAGSRGKEDTNGGAAILTVDSQKLSGDMLADESSAITLTLQNNSSWTGVINTENAAETVNVSLDAGSKWILTGDSYVTVFIDEDGISGNKVNNVSGNGYTIYYDSQANDHLGAGIYQLSGGGYLKPLE